MVRAITYTELSRVYGRSPRYWRAKAPELVALGLLRKDARTFWADTLRLEHYLLTGELLELRRRKASAD